MAGIFRRDGSPGGSTLATYILDVLNGGTGVGALTGIIKGNGAGPFQPALAGTDYLDPSAISTTVFAYDANLQAFVNTFTVPTVDGTANQVLTTNGSGSLVFANETIQTATTVASTPAGNLSASNVQAALNELDVEKAQLATLAAVGGAALIGNTPAGNLTANNLQTALNELQSDVDSRATSSSVVSRTGGTGAAILPTGTTAQRPGTPIAGHLRFNNTLIKPEVYNGTVWGAVGGGATGGGSDEVFIQNSRVVTVNYIIPTGKSASCVGPLTVNSGITLTVASGERLVVL